MIAMNMEIFEGNEFAIQLLAKGTFLDNGTGDGHSYLSRRSRSALTTSR